MRERATPTDSMRCLHMLDGGLTEVLARISMQNVELVSTVCGESLLSLN